MNGNALVWQARILAGDTQKVRYSDYEVYEAINAAVDILCEGLRKYFSPELLRRAELTLTDGRCPLPDNFLYLEQLYTDGRIEGDTLICAEGETNVSMTYGKHPGRIEKDGDILDLSAAFAPDIAYAAASLLRGEVDAAGERLRKAAYEKTPDKRGAIPDEGMWPA